MSHLADTIAAGLEVRYFEPQIEVRFLPDPDVEARGGLGAFEFRGYATVYDQWYDVAGGPEAGGWREMIAAGAGKRTLRGKPDVRLLINHEGLPLARTKSGTLLLTEETEGLLSHAPSLDARDPDVQRIAVKMERRDVDSMSYAFRATRQEWNGDYTERTIREYALDVEGSDVSIVTYPANKATVATLRSAAKIDELRSAALAKRTTTSGPNLSLEVAKAIRERIRAAA